MPVADLLMFIFIGFVTLSALAADAVQDNVFKCGVAGKICNMNQRLTQGTTYIQFRRVVEALKYT